MFKLGLTGSIGMGKSTTGQMFVDRGCPLHDADATVHRLYQGRAVPLIEKAFPGTTGSDGVDRQALSKRVLNNPKAMQKLEAIIHPLVHEEEQTFYRKAEAMGASIVVLDIPLLFETNATGRVDATLVVTASPDQQRTRVMARPGMTEEKFEAILSRQMPDAKKRKRADYIIDTGKGLEEAERQVEKILKDIQRRLAGRAE